MELGTIVAKRVADFREVRGWNQAQLATNAGLSKSVITRAEGAMCGQVDIDTIACIAAALDVSLWQLFAEDACNDSAY